VESAGHQHREHRVTALDCALDDVAVVCFSVDDADAVSEPAKLFHALLTADASHLVASVQRVLHHVLPELPGSSDDANFHGFSPSSNCDRELTEINGIPRSRTFLSNPCRAA
jgi:hypothetical protein